MQDKALNLKNIMNAYSPNLDDLDIKAVEEDLNTIKKRYNYPLKNKTIDNLDKGLIQPIFNNERSKIPSCIPSYLIVSPKTKQPTALFNLTPYGVLTKKSGEMHIDTRQLYAMAENATITLGCFKNWNALTMNQAVLKQGAMMYSKIFCKVLDKMFALNLSVIKSDKVRYYAAKFFLINIMEKPQGSTVDSIAYNCCVGGTTMATIRNDESTFPQGAYESYETFIKALSESIEGFGNLSVRNYLDSYIKMYGPSTVMALEYFPAFCFMIFSAVVGAHLNAEFVLVNLLAKDMDKFYNDVANIVK